MYDLYKQQKGLQSILFIIVITLLAMDVAVWREFFASDRMPPILIFGGVFLLGLAYLFFRFAIDMSKPYSKIDKIRETNPALVQDYEQDYAVAQNIQNTIWFGQKYVFFHAFKFTVARYNEIQNIRLYTHHSKYGSSYELEVTINGEKITVNFSKYSDNKKNVITTAEYLSQMSGAPLTIEFEH